VPLWGIYLEAAKLLLARYKKISKSPDFSPPEEFKNLLMLQEGGRVLTRQADTKGWRALTGGDIRGHLARHATAQLLAENGLSQDVAKLILGHKSDAYAHYYRTISTTHAGRQMRDNYQLGENTVPRRLRAV
jgi:integrase